MEFIELSKKKGFFYQCSNEVGLQELLKKGQVSFYVGFDCTAKSLHVGNLLQIMNIRNLQKYGHKPIILIGSGTSRIGDPSFRADARPVLSDEEIEANKQGIKKSLEKFIKFGSGPTDAIMVDNFDWLSQVNYLSFLRDYGSLISINKMLTYDIIRTRLNNEQNLSFLEFNYMLLQGYDFLHLNKNFNCRLQLGGSDQWVNIINGVELARKAGREEIFALTTPLLTTSSGQKMGKTAAGAVWLNEVMLLPYDYYQFWRNTEDEDVIRFLHIFTDLSDKEIDELSKLQGKEINEAKKILAYQATLLCHGLEEAEKSVKTSQNIFEKGMIEGEIPTIEVDESMVKNDQLNLVEALCMVGFAESKAAARRLIQGGGAKLNGNKELDEKRIITKDDFIDGKASLGCGKKQFAIFKIRTING
jgi:tyrosyl-tRNA synthetase